MFHQQITQEAGGSDRIRELNLLDSAPEVGLRAASGKMRYEELLRWIIEYGND
ncbi:MAG: hypothetical protein ACI38A_04660 [Candidatus Ornithomonoglobus sp.]